MKLRVKFSFLIVIIVFSITACTTDELIDEQYVLSNDLNFKESKDLSSPTYNSTNANEPNTGEDDNDNGAKD